MKNTYVKPDANYLELLLSEDIASEEGEIPGISFGGEGDEEW